MSRFLNVKVLIGTFNKEKALVGAFSRQCKTSRRFIDSSKTTKAKAHLAWQQLRTWLLLRPAFLAALQQRKKSWWQYPLLLALDSPQPVYMPSSTPGQSWAQLP